METLGLVVSVLGVIVSVVLFYTATFDLRRKVAIAFEVDVRKTIERIERVKEKYKTKEPMAYEDLLEVQRELEAMDEKFVKMFEIKSKQTAYNQK